MKKKQSFFQDKKPDIND